MSAGLYLKGFTIANVNGSYVSIDENLTDTNRRWESVDKLYQLRYVPLDPEYIITHDVMFVIGKTYYRLLGTEFVVDEESHAIGDIIPANLYYEQENVGRWEIVPVVNNTPQDEPVFYAKIDDETIDPYYSELKWQDKDGVVLDTVVVDYWDENSFITTTSDPIVDEKEGTVTTVTTTTNIITGEVYREQNVVRTKDVYVETPHDRYVDKNPSIGKVYQFSFVSDFESLGYVKEQLGQPDSVGMYRLDKVLPYLDMIASGIDLYANLYQPLGIDESVYKNDIPRIATSTIYKLIDPIDTSKVIYMPQPFIEDMNPSVRRYEKSMLVIDVGLYGKEYDEVVIQLTADNITKYIDTICAICTTADGEFVNKFVEDGDVGKYIKTSYYEELLVPLFEKQFGIKPEPGKKLAVLTTYDKVWLTDDKKSVMDETLAENKRTSEVSLIKLFELETTNQYFIENRRLKGRIKALEELLTIKSKRGLL